MTHTRIFDRLATLSKEGTAAVLCTVTHTSGSTPRKAGTRMIVLDDGSDYGQIEGSIGGGAVEHRIRSEALLVLKEGHPRQITVSLTHDLSMCCGGQMTVFMQRVQEQSACIVLGAGHIGEAIARLAHQADFQICVADPRTDLLTTERFPYATLFSNYTSTDLDSMPFHVDTYVIIVTHDHEQDQHLVEQVLQRRYRYLALVGSERKALLTRQRCINRGLDPAALRCPAGIHIGAQTPTEIAFSIVAEMILCRST